MFIMMSMGTFEYTILLTGNHLALKKKEKYYIIFLYVIDLLKILSHQYEPMLLEKALKYLMWTIMLLVLVFFKKIVDHCKKINK